VAPLSTVGHWKREFEGWTDLNVVVLQGSRQDRDLTRTYEWHYWDLDGNEIPEHYKFHVLITTFETALSDSHLLGSVPWKLLIVDEAHRIKNRQSKVFQGLHGLKTEHRVLLTGTPIQNNIGELWTLLHFIDPGHFQDAKSFVEDFGEMKESSQVEKLDALLKPYLLRRMKEDVANNIPSKSETIIEVTNFTTFIILTNLTNFTNPTTYNPLNPLNLHNNHNPRNLLPYNPTTLTTVSGRAHRPAEEVLPGDLRAESRLPVQGLSWLQHTETRQRHDAAP
jgi:hypothetical protein